MMDCLGGLSCYSHGGGGAIFRIGLLLLVDLHREHSPFLVYPIAYQEQNRLRSAGLQPRQFHGLIFQLQSRSFIVWATKIWRRDRETNTPQPAAQLITPDLEVLHARMCITMCTFTSWPHIYHTQASQKSVQGGRMSTWTRTTICRAESLWTRGLPV
jgi:hypothetical protein